MSAQLFFSQEELAQRWLISNGLWNAGGGWVPGRDTTKSAGV